MTANAVRLDQGLSVRDVTDEVTQAWRDSGEFTEQTLLRSEETCRRFTLRLDRLGVSNFLDVTPEHCRGFITAIGRSGDPPELATMHARRVVLRMCFRSLRDLGYPVGDPTVDIALPARTSTPARPLTDDEVTLCRAATRLGQAGGASLQRAVAWALAEATAVTSEMTAVRVRDLDDDATPRWAHLPGTRRHDARLGALTDWGSLIVARQVALLKERRLPASTLLLYRGKGEPGQHVAQAAACNALSAVLTAADLSDQPDVRPGSVRNWAGRRLYDDGLPLEHVARRLGSRSLDSAAEDIAIAWRTP